jgi:hypothetical protein
MSFAAAVAHSAHIRCTLDRERDLAAVLVSEALGHSVPPGTVLLALTRAQRDHERRHGGDPAYAERFRRTVFVPPIDAVLDPETGQDFLPYWNRADFTALTTEQRAALLAEIAEIGSDSS